MFLLFADDDGQGIIQKLKKKLTYWLLLDGRRTPGTTYRHHY